MVGKRRAVFVPEFFLDSQSFYTNSKNLLTSLSKQLALAPLL